MKIPVRLLPVVQCMKSAGTGLDDGRAGGGTVERRWVRTVWNMAAPEVRISMKAVTMPYMKCQLAYELERRTQTTHIRTLASVQLVPLPRRLLCVLFVRKHRRPSPLDTIYFLVPSCLFNLLFTPQIKVRRYPQLLQLCDAFGLDMICVGASIEDPFADALGLIGMLREKCPSAYVSEVGDSWDDMEREEDGVRGSGRRV